MVSTPANLLFSLLVAGAAITAFVLLMIFVVVPVFKGIGTGIGLIFQGIGWFFKHIFGFIGGELSDIVRFVGALIAMVVLAPLVPLNIIIGRWSAAGHFGEGVKRECQVAAACVYRAVIQRPLKLVLLHGLLEGLEQRVPEAMHGAPTSDKPSRRSGGVNQFDGYTIMGSLRAGGSGAKLYVAEAAPEKRQRMRHMPDRVVIKSFALTEGSSLPQIVRESRALECAKQLGHVLDHGMDEHRFYYVMPYHPGDHLGILTRQLHGECGGRGLDQKRLNRVMSYSQDLLATLSAYHKGGLWHKDVKPENVIVHDNKAHLVDLGLVTPLRSAMTLTTHGTEYFRDPEMVRQALRGVKVHQVNGAKFDIYAAGAVLYFMIENTFPAHGGLSRFAAKSPEALRWIVRRAMTEYHQRYATADDMLNDLRFVMDHKDAFAVKPADLPSMRGDAPLAPMAEDAATVVAVAASAVPPKHVKEPAFTGFGIAAGVDETGAFGQVGALNLDDNGKPLPKDPPTTGSKPRLTVTNWWTGEYRPEAADGGEMDSREFRRNAFAFRDQAEQISRQAQAGIISARKAAREQIKAARQRAKEMRTRAMARRHRVVPGARTSMSTIVIGTLSVLFLAGVLAMTFFSRSVNSGVAHSTASSSQHGRPVVLAIDSEVALTDSLRSRIKSIAEDYRERGYTVIEGTDALVSSLLPALREWKDNPNGQADIAIEDFLAAQNAWGVVHVPVTKSKKSGRGILQETTFVYSTRPGAEQRRLISPDELPAPPAGGQPYLLINDHPAKADIAVAAEIERQLKAYRHRGWTLVTDDDAEVKVRNVLPLGPIERGITLPNALHIALAEAGFGGIMRIDGKAGSEPPSQRVSLVRIDRDPAVAAPVPANPDAEDVVPPSASSTPNAPQATVGTPG